VADRHFFETPWWMGERGFITHWSLWEGKVEYVPQQGNKWRTTYNW